jgi:hypothetical protein
MQEFYYIKSSKSHTINKISGHDLVAIITKASEDLQHMIADGYVPDKATSPYGLTSNGYEQLYAYLATPDAADLGGVTYRNKAGSDAIHQFHKDIGYSIVKNKHFTKNVVIDKAHKGMWFYDVRQLEPSKFNHPPGDTQPRKLIIKVSLADGTTCMYCNAVVESRHIVSHQLSVKCFIKQPVSDEYVRIGNSISLSILGEIGIIPYVFMPASYEVHVPGWVDKAVETFNKNDGYAGMSLVEYLKRIATTHNK